MNREELIDRILYSHYLEKLFSVLMGGIDRTISTLLIVLGSAVVMNVLNHIITGLLIAIISAIQLAFHFGKSSSLSLQKSKQYQKLYSQKDTYDDADLLIRYFDLEENDDIPWSLLQKPAMICTRRHQNIPKDDGLEPRLTIVEKISMFLAGG